jgi:hypothetical protein
MPLLVYRGSVDAPTVTRGRKQNVVRISVAVSKPNLEWATQEATRLGISVSELFRRVLDEAKQRRLDKVG